MMTFSNFLVHLGLPLWQLRFTSMGLPPGANQLIMLLAPHLLKNKNDKEDDKYPIQSIDPTVFKMRNRNRKSMDKNKADKF